MNYEQFLAKHATSAKWQNLTKAEKKARYQTYLNSGPNPKYGRKAAAPIGGPRTSSSVLASKGSPSQGRGRGQTAYSSLCQTLGLQLSPATHDYLTLLYNPFCPRVTGVGYPDGAPGGSQKATGFTTFNIATNAAGFGFVLCNPVALAANNVAGISYSSSTAYAQASDAFPGSAGGAGIANIPFGSGIQYSTASGANGMMWRLVAFGVRIRSTQAPLSKQGSVKATCLPVADADAWGVTGGQLLTEFRKYSHRYIGNELTTPWFSAVWSPSAPSNGQFVRTIVASDVPAANAIYCDISQAGAFGAAGTGLLISGAPSSTFECEVYGHYEYFGAIPTLTGLQTPSYSDPVGIAAVNAVSAAVNPIAAEKNSDGGVLFSSILSGATSVANAVSKTLSYGAAPDTSSINGMTVAQMNSYLPSVPGSPAITDNVSDGPSLGGFLSDSVKSIAPMLPELLAML